ncbi:MAG: hypothetical protein Q7K55_05915 [Candidatus Levybacteria bacterium]|nr:hypothetical protein [Candidatus Levybacteria bacterium]
MAEIMRMTERTTGTLEEEFGKLKGRNELLDAIDIPRSERSALLVAAINNLIIPTATPERLIDILGSEEAKRVIDEGGKRDMYGGTIILERSFGITEDEAKAAQLFFGLQDGKQRSLQLVGQQMNLNKDEAEQHIISIIRKLTENPQKPVVLPGRP